MDQQIQVFGRISYKIWKIDWVMIQNI